MDHTPGGAQECEPVEGDAQLSEIQLLKRAMATFQHPKVRGESGGGENYRGKK